MSNIIAIADWSHALIGDPTLELTRIAEYGHLSLEFLQGYGNPNFFDSIPQAVELIYRLDTAVMLAVLFLSEMPEPNQAKKRVDRVIELYNILKILI